jgi:hypothetical protein
MEVKQDQRCDEERKEERQWPMERGEGTGEKSLIFLKDASCDGLQRLVCGSSSKRRRRT